MKDEVQNIVKFNEIAGNDSSPRELSDENIEAQLNYVVEEFDEMNASFEKGDEVGVLDGAADLVVTAIGLIHRLGYDAGEVMNVVNSANFSKFVYNEEDAKSSIEAYNEDERYEDVFCEWIPMYDGGDQTVDVGVIKGRKKGTDGLKILKGVNTRKPEPELEELVKEKYNSR